MDSFDSQKNLTEKRIKSLCIKLEDIYKFMQKILIKKHSKRVNKVKVYGFQSELCNKINPTLEAFNHVFLLFN